MDDVSLQRQQSSWRGRFQNLKKKYELMDDGRDFGPHKECIVTGSGRDAIQYIQTRHLQLMMGAF